MTKEKFRKFAMAILVAWVISIFVIGICYYFIIVPQKSHLEKLSSRVEQEIETNLVSTHTHEKKAAELMKMKMAEAGALIDDFIVERSDVTDFIFDFKRMADACGIVDFTGSYDPSSSYTDIAGYSKINEGSLRINFSGDYMQFITMINNFERYKPIIFIDRFDISRVRRQRENSNINMTLTYYSTK